MSTSTTISFDTKPYPQACPQMYAPPPYTPYPTDQVPSWQAPPMTNSTYPGQSWVSNWTQNLPQNSPYVEETVQVLEETIASLKSFLLPEGKKRVYDDSLTKTLVTFGKVTTSVHWGSFGLSKKMTHTLGSHEEHRNVVLSKNLGKVIGLSIVNIFGWGLVLPGLCAVGGGLLSARSKTNEYYVEKFEKKVVNFILLSAFRKIGQLEKRKETESALYQCVFMHHPGIRTSHNCFYYRSELFTPENRLKITNALFSLLHLLGQSNFKHLVKERHKKPFEQLQQDLLNNKNVPSQLIWYREDRKNFLEAQENKSFILGLLKGSGLDWNVPDFVYDSFPDQRPEKKENEELDWIIPPEACRLHDIN